MKTILSFTLALLPVLTWAQGMKPAGTSADNIVPEGWQKQEVRGDLNKDGFEDLVIIATPDNAENMLTRDDGYVYNFNQPLLAVYFGTGDGSFKLWKQYSDVLAHQVDEYLFVNSSLDISPRGTLKISLEYFASAGSADTSQNTYTFRFQDGDIFLIGKDTNSFSRYSGEATNESYNYLTRKQKTTTSNAFDKSVRPKEVWTKLPKTPLQRLGDFRIE